MSATTTEPNNIDILRAVSIELPCPSCGGRYGLTLGQVLLSQQVIHDGCPVQSVEDCGPVVFAPLLDHATILALQHAWGSVNEQAAAIGGEVALTIP